MVRGPKVSQKDPNKFFIHFSDWLTVGCLETLVFHQSNLQELNLSNCVNLSERSISILLNNFRDLRVLSLMFIPTVTDNVLFAMSKYSLKLRHLNLVGCTSITDKGIR